MSVRATARVWETSPRKGSALLLLLAIADYAKDDGSGAYPSIETLAEKVRLSPRHIQRLIRELQAEGELVVEEKAGPRGCNLYHVQLCQGGDNLSGVTSCQGDAGVAKGVTSASERGDTHVTQTVIDPLVDPLPPSSVQDSDESFTPEGGTAPPQKSVSKSAKRITEITPEFRAQMHERFDPVFGPQGVDERIEEAIAHRSYAKWTDKQAGVRNWLRGDAERKPPQGGQGRQYGKPGANLETYRNPADRREGESAEEYRDRRLAENAERNRARNGDVPEVPGSGLRVRAGPKRV